MAEARGADDPQDHEAVVDITPQAPPEPDAGSGPGPRWVGPLLVVGLPLVVVAGVAALLFYLLFAAPEFPETDPRACPGSVEPLEAVASRIGLRVPGDARDVHYLTSSAASGKPPVQVAFRVPQDELVGAMQANGLVPDGSSAEPAWAAVGGMCGLDGDPGADLAAWRGSGSRDAVSAQVSSAGNLRTVQVLVVVAD